MAEHKWPTRKEWAKRERTLYADLLDDLVSTKIADYASADEVAAALAELREVWKSYGRTMRAAKQSGDMDIVSTCDWRRRDINSLSRKIRNGRYILDIHLVRDHSRDLPTIEIIRTRYDAAYKAAEKKKRQEIAAKPIDDAAWAKELERRARLEAWGRAGHFVVLA